MTTRTVRVTVRGRFAGLTDAQLAELVAEGAEHDMFGVVWGPDGHLSYELPARPFFAFRFAEQAADEAEIPRVAARAEAKAAAWMAGRGFPVADLSSQAVDMSAMPLGARGRRRADAADR